MEKKIKKGTYVLPDYRMRMSNYYVSKDCIITDGDDMVFITDGFNEAKESAQSLKYFNEDWGYVTLDEFINGVGTHNLLNNLNMW